MDNLKPCPLSEEQIIAIADQVAWRKSDNTFPDNATVIDFARRLLSAVPTQAEPVYPEDFDAEFLAKRLGRVARIAGVPMPERMSNDQIAACAGTILGQIAYELEHRAPPAPSSEADLVDALQSIAANTCCGTCQEAAQVASAALAKHGTQAATPALSLTAYGEKVREAAAKAAWPDEKVWSEDERDAMAAAYKRAKEKGRGFYETLFAVGAVVAKANFAAIRSMPLPAIEGEEK